MNTDKILRTILVNPKLKELYWPEIKNPESQNLNTINMSPNKYLKYLYIVLSDQNDNTRNNSLANLLNY
jgi:hypothetical protein